MTRHALVLSLIAAACGSTQPPREEKLGASEHLAEAQRHERVAAEHQSRANVAESAVYPTWECIDQPLAGEPTSGTETIHIIRPCWRTETIADHRRAAYRNLEEAAAHRRAAASLLAAERASCAGLGAEEISHGLFFHVEDIVRVEPYEEDGMLRGVTAVFARVRGLDALWLQRAASCELARAESTGHRFTFMPYSPLSLPDVRVKITETPEGFAVTVHSDYPEIARAALLRATELVRTKVRGKS